MGVEKSIRRDENFNVDAKFLQPFEIVALDDRAAVHYARIRAHLENSGSVIGPDDMIIAATVIAKNGVLIGYNVKEFKQVPGPQLEAWVVEGCI